MISFEVSSEIRQQLKYAESIARKIIRPQARYYDDNEHESPWDYAYYIWETARKVLPSLQPGGASSEEPLMMQIHTNEMISWGDAGFYLSTPWPALGGAAIKAIGTDEQKKRFLGKFKGEKPAWTSMALSEAHCGSDAAAIRTRAVADGNCWILNGEKLFATNARRALIESNGIVIVWATIDPSTGRAGIRPFVIEANTPGLTITKLEKKMGIRASETAVVTLEDCRIPLDNMLGDPKSTGFKGAMAALDSARPSISASGLGVARAALEFLKEHLTQNGIAIRYNMRRHLLTSIERDVIDMEAQLQAAWLLAVKAAWRVDQHKPNTIESSMCKIKTGYVAARITQKTVEIMGTLGYSHRLPLEKWMRDGRISDLFEGTGQINRLIVARRILGYSSKELK